MPSIPEASLTKTLILSQCYTQDGGKFREATQILRDWGKADWKIIKGYTAGEFAALRNLSARLCLLYRRIPPSLVSSPNGPYSYTPAPPPNPELGTIHAPVPESGSPSFMN